MPRGAVFLDRDGVIVEDVNYLSRPDQLTVIPGAATAIRRLNGLGIPVVIVTNQSVVARGMISESGLKAIHERLRALLADDGARLDGLYYCPHHPEVGEPPYRAVCSCRKPEPGMFLQAAADLDVALDRSVMIGDSLHDLEAGRRAGCRFNILALTGHGPDELANLCPSEPRPSLVAQDLAAAVDWALERLT